MKMRNVNRLIIEEMVAPAVEDLKNMTKAEFKAELYDMVSESSIGIAKDLAMFCLDGADWDHLFFQMKSLSKR